MTGLDLESFLLLLRTDLTGWAVVILSSMTLAILVWLSWGARRGLRKCLVASLVAHVGLAYFARSVPAISHALGAPRSEDPDRVHIREIRVLPASVTSGLSEFASRSPQVVLGDQGTTSDPTNPAGRLGRPLDQTIEPLVVAETPLELKSIRPESKEPSANQSETGAAIKPSAPIPVAVAVPSRRPAPPRTEVPLVGDLGPKSKVEGELSSIPGGVAPSLGEIDKAEIPPVIPPPATTTAEKPDPKPMPVKESLAIVPDRSLREGSGSRSNPRPSELASSATQSPEPLIRLPDSSIPIVRGTPKALEGSGTATRGTGRAGEGLVDLLGAIGRRPIQDVPSVYRPRLDPNRSDAAKRAGASDASEQAVERALDWLSRHQDQDGRWDGGTARDVQGNAVDDDDFTAHCPPGQVCFGECVYWEADTALTGLALLTFLGSGYTHTDGRYKSTVENGLRFLIKIQEPNGDLRGRSRAVGMYCHAMAALALCEAYALTGDKRLRDPATRGVSFAVSARAKDRQAWRYAPGEPIGDTSILGWVVMLLKSARESKLSIPNSSDIQAGILKWLDAVASGAEKGLARYQPTEPVTPTMTAEAWVCRQFLGEGGPGAASEEAALHLLSHPTDRGKTNLYYWYYATLAMYQHGGENWTRWNKSTRDKLVKLQRTSGHMTGSWDPDESIYGINGGRIYCTAMAALTLEVYYRYLRLYDRPSLPISSDRANSLPDLIPPSP